MKKFALCLPLLLPLSAWAADSPTQMGVAAWSYPVYDGADTQ